MAMLHIRSLKYRHEDSSILSFPDWLVCRGETWLVTGNSGSGKTTLLHLITGLLRPGSGEITVDDTCLSALSGAELDRFRGRHIGIVFQRPHLIKSMCVLDNLLLAQSLARIKPSAQNALKILDALGIGDKSKNYPTQLSEGQLQRVAIARAVVNQPGLLIADEPTSSLDHANAAMVLELLTQQAQQNGATLIIATHDSRLKEKIHDVYHIRK